MRNLSGSEIDRRKALNAEKRSGIKCSPDLEHKMNVGRFMKRMILTVTIMFTFIFR